MSKLNCACDATPSPPKPPSAGPPAALAPGPMAGAASLAAGPRPGPAHSSKEDLVAAAAAAASGPIVQQVLAAGAGEEAEKRRAAAGHYRAAGHAEDARPSFGEHGGGRFLELCCAWVHGLYFESMTSMGRGRKARVHLLKAAQLLTPHPLAAGAAGGRQAIWEQELSRELRQLPSQWRYQAPAGNRRMSMHGSPMKG